MAIAYKGFRLYEFVTATGETVADYGNFEISIVTRKGGLYSGIATSVQQAIDRLNANTDYRESIIGITRYYSSDAALSALREILPAINDKNLPALPTGHEFKAVAANGSYMVGINSFDVLFDSTGQQIGTINGISFSTGIDCQTAYFTIDNFDGTVPSSGLLRRSVAYVQNMSPLYYRLDEGSTSGLNAAIAAWFNDIGPLPPEDTDPYAPGGNSEPGGGTGNFDLTSDQIDVPNVPTLSAVDTGLVTLYTPTLAQLQSLARYLWNADATTVDWWKKLIANPLDLVLGLSIVPVAVPQGATENVYVGLIDTGIAMTKAASQYVQVDCGSLNITEFYGAALDYLPFRKTSIYLPFIGTRTISTDDIMGKTVQVVYNIDLLSGALTAMVKCGDAVLYQYSGACNIAIPLSGQSFTDLALSTLQLAAGIGATVATGGAVAGVVAANAANSVMSMKPTIERAGGVSGAAGQLAIMRPYLIGEIPRQSVPEKYNKFAGYPSNISAVLGDLEGYTEVETIYLEGITATSDELNEIETLLKSGVYI